MKREVHLGDRKVTVVGTAHVSEESVQRVRDTITEVSPDLVAVELDDARLESMRNENGWRDLDISEAIRDGKGFMLAVNLFLSIEQKRMGLETGTPPGTEMLAALDMAEETGINTALVDRDINSTFRRMFSGLTLWEKAKLLASLFAGEGEMDVEELEEEQMVDLMVKELSDEFPSLKETFLDERNSYMADRLMKQEFDHAVLVVGAAHLEGVVEELENSTDYVEEDVSSINWLKYLNYGLIGLILFGFIYSFTQIDFSRGVRFLAVWVGANGILASLGAVLARAHPVTWLISFVSAPLTSLYPALGAGMVASYAEAKLYPPTVGELEEITSLTDYWALRDNQVGRILLTFLLVTLGSAIATFMGAGYFLSILPT